MAINKSSDAYLISTVEPKIDLIQTKTDNLPNNTSSSFTVLNDYGTRAVGETESKVITLDANNTTASVNIFQITGTVKIQRLYAEVTNTSTLTNCTAASFDLFPTGGAAIQISAAGGVLSGVPVGTYIFKEGLAANNFVVNDATLGAVAEQTYEGADVLGGFIVTQKTAVDTFIRFTYTTTDAPIDAAITVYVEYIALGAGILAAV